MIAQTYCGELAWDGTPCDEKYGPCPSCLRDHVARLEEALDAATEEILLSRQSEGETMRDLLETREKLATADAAEAKIAQAVAAPEKKEKDCGDCKRIAVCNETLACLCGPDGKLFVRAQPQQLEAHHTTEVKGGGLSQPNNEIDRLRARNAELEAQAAAQAGSVVVPELTRRQSTDIANEAQEITGRWIWPSTVEAIAKVMRSRFPASRVLGEGEVAVSEEELVSLRCLDDAVTINGDGMFTEALGVDWEVARSAKKRLADIRAAKGEG